MRVCAAPGCEEEFNPQSHNQKYHSPQCKRDVENMTRRRALASDLVAALAPAYLSADDIEAQAQLEFLRKENQRLSNAAEKYKNAKHELVEAVYKAAHDALSKIQIPEVAPPGEDVRTNSEEVANPVCADWQLGKVTPTYSSEVCEQRIHQFTDKIIQLTNIQRADHPVRRAHVYMLGDIVEGEEIFSGQSHQIDSSLYAQVVNGVKLTAEMIRRLLSQFEQIHFVGVIGNHGAVGGRARKDMNGETNMDRMLYKFTELMFQDNPRVTFNIPEGYGERNFYAVDYIGDYGTLLVHGDQFPVPTSLHSYRTKVLGWKAGAIPEPFDDVFMGHYHQNTKATFGTTVLRVCGTPESNNTFAQERLAAMGRPSQHLQFVHPKKGVTCEYDCWLD